MATFAAVQMEPALFDAEANLVKVIDFMHEVSICKAEIAVFPECALTGYALSAEEAAFIAEPIPGPRTDRLSAACREADLTAIVVGTIEKDEFGQLFNTAVLVGPEGLIARYRKTHLPYLGVDRYLAEGDALPGPIETRAGRIGLLICYDLRFPEPCRVLAIAGAQVLLLPTAWPKAATLYPDFMVQSRAAENCIFVVAANRVGEERGTRYLGRSVIAGPDGEMLAEAGTEGEEILCVEIEPDQSDLKQRIFVPGEYELHLFEDRRPELYRSIVE
jgi:predicted amidohydrolase